MILYYPLAEYNSSFWICTVLGYWYYCSIFMHLATLISMANNVVSFYNFPYLIIYLLQIYTNDDHNVDVASHRCLLLFCCCCCFFSWILDSNGFIFIWFVNCQLFKFFMIILIFDFFFTLSIIQVYTSHLKKLHIIIC